MNKFQEALYFATDAHADQTRWDKKTPYITHPVAVARAMERGGWDEKAQIAALLHDVLEDTAVMAHQIRNDFGEEVLRIVEILTRRGDDNGKEPYSEYISRVVKDRRASAIKLCDLNHNMSNLRPGSMRDKYMIAKMYLEDHLKLALGFPPSDYLTYLEAARLAFECYPHDLGTRLDISIAEHTRLQKQLEGALNPKEGKDGEVS